MNLYKITTVTPCVNTYWIEAQTEYDAKAEVLSLHSNVIPAKSYFSQENIVSIEKTKEKHFTKWLHTESKDPDTDVSTWMGRSLIHTTQDDKSSNVFKSMATGMILGTPAIE